MTRYFPIRKQRNGFGRMIRKDYEAGRMPDIRRKDIKEFAPRDDDMSGTITSVTHDNLLMEVYE